MSSESKLPKEIEVDLGDPVDPRDAPDPGNLAFPEQPKLEERTGEPANFIEAGDAILREALGAEQAQTADKTSTAIGDFEERRRQLKELPTDVKASAFLGFKNPNETISRMPRGSVIIAIQHPASKKEAVHNALYKSDTQEHSATTEIGDAAELFIRDQGLQGDASALNEDVQSQRDIPLSAPLQSSNFMGSTSGNQDAIVTSFHLVPSGKNLPKIAERMASIGSDINITSSDSGQPGLKPSTMLLRTGTSIIVINQRLSSDKVLYPNTSDAPLPTTELRGPRDQRVLWGDLSKLTNAAYQRANEDANSREKRGTLPPHNARCNYLVINPRTLSSGVSQPQIRRGKEEEVKGLGDQIASLANAQGVWLEQINGQIVIISVVERAGSDVRRRMKQISEKHGNRITQVYGSGQIQVAEDGGSYRVEGFPTELQLQTAEEHSRGDHTNIYMLDSQVEDANTNRDSTHYSLEIQPIDGSDLSVINEIESKIKLKVGGPDIRIGLDQQSADLESSTGAMSQSRLTILKGAAGTGKSVLLDELTGKRKTLVISLDPAKKSVPGGQLVLAADQIAERMGEVLSKLAESKGRGTEPLPYAQRIEEYAKGIQEFSQKTEEEKLKMATSEEEARKLMELCVGALKAYEFTEGSFVFVFDDVHHSDRTSEKPLMDMVKNFIHHCKSSRAVLALRPEQMYKSREQRNLESWVQLDGDERLTSINVEALPFASDLAENESTPEESLLYKYIFHSLPKEVRHNITTHTDRKLGDWWQKLAEISSTPLELTTYLYKALRPENIIFDETTVNIRSEVIDGIVDQARSGDIGTIHLNRINDELGPKEKQFLCAIAMLGKRVDTDTSDKLLAEFIDSNPTQETEMLNELELGGFLVRESGSDTAARRLQHDTLRDALLKSMSAAEKRNLGQTLFKLLPDLPAEVKFSLLHNSAADSAPRAARFWIDYCDSFDQCLQGAIDNDQTDVIRDLSLSFLHDLDGLALDGEEAKDPETRIGKFIKSLKERNDRPPAVLLESVIMAMRSAADASRLQGRFTETYALVDALIDIYKKKGPSKKLGQTEIADICELGFQAAYDERNPQRIESYQSELSSQLTEELTDPTGARALLLEYKSEYKAAGKDVIKLASLREKFTSQEYDTCHLQLTLQSAERNTGLQRQFERLKLRIDFELINQTVNTQRNLDDDASVQPNHLTTAETRQLFELRKKASDMLEVERQTPGSLEKIELLYLLDQQAEIEALLGNYEGRSIQLGATQTSEADAALLDSFLEKDGEELIPRATRTLSSAAHYEPGAIEIGEDAWRLAAVQLGMSAMAMRIATNLANAKVISATTRVNSHAAATEDKPGHFTVTSLGEISADPLFERQKILEAIDIYTNQAIKLGENVTDREAYQMVARVNRLRAISLLCLSLDTKLASAEPIAGQTGRIAAERSMRRDELHREFAPYYNLAIEDLSYLNTNSTWGNMDSGGEMAYFIASSAGHIMEFATRAIQGFNRNIEVETQLPHLHPDAIEGALNNWIVGKTESDDLGEVDRKVDGLEAYIKGVMAACVASPAEEQFLGVNAAAELEETPWKNAVHQRYGQLLSLIEEKKAERESAGIFRGSIVEDQRGL
jgi:hypothetical protein